MNADKKKKADEELVAARENRERLEIAIKTKEEIARTSGIPLGVAVISDHDKMRDDAENQFQSALRNHRKARGLPE